MQIPITRWPKTVQQRSLKISCFLYFLLRSSRAFLLSFCECVWQLLSAIPVSNSFLQPKFATPVCNFFARLLFITSFCSACLQFHFAATVCNSVCSSCLQLVRGTALCSSFLKLLLAGPSFDLAFVCPLLKLLLLLLLLLLL